MFLRLSALCVVIFLSPILKAQISFHDPFYLKPKCSWGGSCALYYRHELVFKYVKKYHDELRSMVVNAKKQKKKIMIDHDQFVIKNIYKNISQDYDRETINYLSNHKSLTETIDISERTVEFEYMLMTRDNILFNREAFFYWDDRVNYDFKITGKRPNVWVSRELHEYLQEIDKDMPFWINKTALDDPKKYFPFLDETDIINTDNRVKITVFDKIMINGFKKAKIINEKLKNFDTK